MSIKNIISTINYPRILTFIFITLILIIIGLNNYLLFHSLVELFSIVIAFSLAIIAFNTKDISENKFLIFLGIVYGFSAILGLIHTLAYKGMNIFVDYSANLPTQLWIASRFFESLSLLVAFSFLKKKFNFKYTFLFYLGITVILLFLIFNGFFPDCFIEGQGLTTFKIISEYIIILTLVIGIFLLSRTQEYFNVNIKKYIFIFFALSIICELSFTLYIDVYGVFNMIGHIIKLFSYYYLYKALTQATLQQPYNTLFYRLNKTNRQLKDHTTELMDSNQKLKEEIEEREKTEKALRKSQNFNQAILDSLNTNIAVIDNQGKITAVNKHWIKFGKENGKLDSDIGKNYLEITKKACEEDDMAACEICNGLEQVMSGEKDFFSQEYPCHSPWEKRWFLLQATPLDIVNGGAVISHIDITERRENEEELRILTQAVEQSSSTVVITNSKGTIEYVNPKFTEITGYSRKEALGENPRILKSGLQADEIYRELWDNISRGQEWRGELCNIKKNGELYWEYVSISPVKNKKGEITHYIGVKEDITGRKKMEKQLRKAKQEAEVANKAKSQFLAQMSHEIRTPMNGILGMTDLLLDMEQGNKTKRYLKMISNSANMLLSIINDILDFSKIEAGKLQLEKTSFDLKQLISQILDTFIYKAKEKNIELKYHIDPQINTFIIGDPGRLQQILINLIGNALKFTDRGKIMVEIEKVSKDIEIQKLKFSVIDTGIGIPEKEQEKLFKSFSQLNNNQYQKKGTGLGLAICQRLVELMEGEIGVNSTPGQGSTFYFTIPFKISNRKSIDKSLSASTKNNKQQLNLKKDLKSHSKNNSLNILLVEDNKVNQELAIAILTKKGWKVDPVSNGQQAIEYFKENNYDLVLMDIQMPDIDGFEVTNQIRNIEKKPNIHTPIIAMTAYAMAEDKERCLKAGMDGFISKPIKANKLYETIENNINLLEQNVAVKETATVDKNNTDPADSDTDKNIFNLDYALNNTAHNKQLLKQLVNILLSNYPNQLKEIKQAIDDNNPEQLKQKAHGLKGSLGNFTEGKPYRLAYRLEKMGKNNEMNSVIETYQQLKNTLKKLEKILSKIDWEKI